MLVASNSGLAKRVKENSSKPSLGDLGVCVHDDFQRRGVGSALMAELIDVADNWLDLKRLELTVYVDNEPAIRLYQKVGSRWSVAVTHSAMEHMLTRSSWRDYGSGWSARQ
jgi:RimJ/RimL family protein N-acetyltransferase